MTQALLDILLAPNPDAPEGETAPSSQRQSIGQHLQRLLKARRGVLPHLPAYGLPDIAQNYLALPYSQDFLMASVRQCVADFEPRLQQVKVRFVALNEQESCLELALSGRTAQGRLLVWGVKLHSSGQVKVLTVGE